MAAECVKCGDELYADGSCPACRIEELEDKLAQACEAMTDRCKDCCYVAWTPLGCLNTDCALQQFSRNVTWRVR